MPVPGLEPPPAKNPSSTPGFCSCCVTPSSESSSSSVSIYAQAKCHNFKFESKSKKKLNEKGLKMRTNYNN